MSRSDELPFEIILHILGFVSQDYTTLHRCLFVDRRFGAAASKLLYSSVVFWPSFQPYLDLKAKDGIYAGEPSVFLSSLLSDHGTHVASLTIGGFLSTRPPPTNLLPGTLLAAVRHYTNLRSVAFIPSVYHNDVFRSALDELAVCGLQRLEVNASCCDETNAPLLIKLRGLRVLTVRDPGRAVLQLMPEWLEGLMPTLRELHLKDNCGSITPGVLRSFVPYLQAVRAVSLGLSYSLADADVFAFLAQLPQVEEVELQYYLQFNSPKRVLSFPRMRIFTVKHSRMDTREDASHLCVWVRRIIASAPIERLSFVCTTDHDEMANGPSISFDGLVGHLLHRHSHTLRHLHLNTGLVGKRLFRNLLQQCTELESFGLTVNKDTFQKFSLWASGLNKLHASSFDLANTKHQERSIDLDTASSIFKTRLPSLRSLTVGTQQFEGEWKCNSAGDTVFTVQQVSTPTLPWMRQRK
ncbi:hypothetical protein HGRIS_007005 [Hohenbuehelia grisea]|uniref:F-box domain-containing protein n=1 Tax=Hohenbuehelia grisea TaxID=104357 RepID=A0ABR3JCD2_9AGAR